MTVIVGIKCQDGVVIGSDSAMTFALPNQQATIEQRFNEKIRVLGRCNAIIAGTGAAGLHQRFVAVVDRILSNTGMVDNVIEFSKEVTKEALEDFSYTSAEVNYGALVAAVNREYGELIEFETFTLQPEVKSKGNWYVSAGIGQLAADPILAFVRSVFWHDNPPTLQDGIFACVLVLDTVIEMAPIGICGPVQMAKMYINDQGNLTASLLSESEIGEQRVLVEEAKAHFSDFPKAVESRPAPSPGA